MKNKYIIHGVICCTDSKEMKQVLRYACIQAVDITPEKTSVYTGKKITCKRCLKYFGY